MRRLTSVTRLFAVRLMTVPMYNLGHTTFFDAPGPGVSFTFSRNALMMLLGYAAKPSVQINIAHNERAHRRTCCIKLSVRLLSLFLLTSTAIHKRVGTIIANATQRTASLILPKFHLLVLVSGLKSLARLSLYGSIHSEYLHDLSILPRFARLA